MDVEIVTGIEKGTICRLCATICDINAVCIFDDCGSQDNSIQHKIQECTSIEVKIGDGLPGIVCQNCAFKIEDWYSFKLLAKASDDSLRKIILGIKHEVIEIEPVIFGPSVDEYDIGGTTTDDEENIPLINFACEKKLAGAQNCSKAKRKYGKRKEKLRPYCIVCSEKFLRLSELVEHQKSAHGAGEDVDEKQLQEQGVDCNKFAIYRCHVCSEQFTDRKTLRNHCRLIHDVKVIHPYVCNYCSRQFPSWGPLVVHERKHSGNKPYSCDSCGKENFISLASLRRHKLMHDKVFSCSDCGKDFNCESALKAHIRCKHTGEKPYLCNICGRSFSLVAILQAHMTSHSNERKYKCDICGFRSKTSGNHHRHRARHNTTAPKIFHCETCGKAFESKLKLSSHSIIHRPVRPHSCKLCGKGFIYKNKLERHILQVHAKERPYPCIVCGRKLASKFGLGIHMKTHSKKETGAAPDAPSSPAQIDQQCQPNHVQLVQISPNMLNVSNNGHLVLEEVKAGLLYFKPTS